MLLQFFAKPDVQSSQGKETNHHANENRIAHKIDAHAALFHWRNIALSFLKR
jgi:hypothetical protein